MAKRVQRKRVKGWRKPENAVIVDRTSIFGNPFPVAKYGFVDSRCYYTEWLKGEAFMHVPALVELRKKVMARIHELRGKDLVCFCPEDAEWCHADELILMANKPENGL